MAKGKGRQKEEDISDPESLSEDEPSGEEEEEERGGASEEEAEESDQEDQEESEEETEDVLKVSFKLCNHQYVADVETFRKRSL